MSARICSTTGHTGRPIRKTTASSASILAPSRATNLVTRDGKLSTRHARAAALRCCGLRRRRRDSRPASRENVAGRRGESPGRFEGAGGIRSALEQVRNVGDDGVLAEEQRALHQQRGLIVKDVLPPPSRRNSGTTMVTI